MLKRMIPYLLAILILAGSIVIVSGSVKTEPPEKSTSDEMKTPVEMRALWVTFMTLDTEGASNVKETFCQKIDTIVSDMKEDGFNTMIVQVRPFCDAIYRSNYFSWSHILTGTQGQDPGFDPLAYICERCKDEDISIHAWVNPYRVSTAETPDELSEDNPVMEDPSLMVEVNGARYLDPGNKKAQELIVDGVIELLTRYDIDGIQFDDYFYPENCGDFDSEGYQEYCASTASPLALEEYRKENVNTLIRSVYQAVHQADRSAVFGVSPQGNLENNKALYADVKLWCEKEGYIDYICPQIYFSLDNPALTYEDALEQWIAVKKHDGLRFYIGLAGYKAGTDADSGTWLDNSDILRTEIEIAREAECDGFMLYSYDSLHNSDNEKEIKNVIRYLKTSPTQ